MEGIAAELTRTLSQSMRKLRHSTLACPNCSLRFRGGSSAARKMLGVTDDECQDDTGNEIVMNQNEI
jgi:hypothetical protein